MKIAIVGFLIFYAYAAAAIFKRTRIPDVLLLVFLGITVGPFLKLVEPSEFGVVGEQMGTIALVVLLFHGGATLNVTSLYSSWRLTVVLTLLAFASGTAIIALGGVYLFGLPLHSASLLGLICGGTSSAVVIPLVQGLGLSDRTSTVLVLESALTDVLSIVLVFALVNAGSAAGGSVGFEVASSVGTTMLFSPMIGFAAALAWTAVAVRSTAERLEPLAAMALAFVVYGVSNSVGYSGGLAVLAFGFGTVNAKLLRFDRLIGTMSGADYEAINEMEMFFLTEIIFMLKTFFFVFLGISMYLPHNVEGFVPIIVIAVYLARAFIVRITSGSSTSLRDASLTSVMAPKGLAAAVLASVPLQAGIAGGEVIRDKTYLMVLVSIIITAVAVPLIDKRLLTGLFSFLTGAQDTNDDGRITN